MMLKESKSQKPDNSKQMQTDKPVKNISPASLVTQEVPDAPKDPNAIQPASFSASNSQLTNSTNTVQVRHTSYFSFMLSSP